MRRLALDERDFLAAVGLLFLGAFGVGLYLWLGMAIMLTVIGGLGTAAMAWRLRR